MVSEWIPIRSQNGQASGILAEDGKSNTKFKQSSRGKIRSGKD